MTNKNRPAFNQAAAPVPETVETVAAEAAVEANAEAVAEAAAPAAPANMGAPLANILKAAVNDMHHYGVISDAEAVSLKERIEAKS